MRRRLAVAAVLVAALPVAAASARPRRAPDWAGPEIRWSIGHGVFGRATVRSFRPNAPLTRQALANLAFDLRQVLAPTVAEPPLPPPPDPAPMPLDPQSPGAVPVATATRDPTVADPAPSTPAPTRVEAVQLAPATPPRVTRPRAPATMAALDAHLVASLSLSDAAAEFENGARAAGLAVPARFGNEVVARLVGLRLDHPAAQDFLERRPQDPATRAEAAYSAARILGLGWLGNSWETAAVRSLADSFSLPRLTPWQRRILDVAVSKIGMPYIWGGTHDGHETPFGVAVRGGYDCSGFAWRVYKLQRYPHERTLASTLQGRTTFLMSVEVPRSERIPFSKLEPADLLFFGAHGARSTADEIDHMGIYLGNGWFIQSSDDGVALATLTAGYRMEFAWGRRPLREAGLTR